MILPGKTDNPRRFENGEEQMPENESMEATPEEQEDYDLLSIRGRKMIFGPAKDDILAMLGSSETPAKGMGQAASMIIKSLIQSAKQSGREISPDAALEAALDVVEDLNDLAKANDVFSYDSPKDEEQELADSVLWGVKYYGDGMVNSGELTPEIQDAANQEVQRAMAEEQPKQTPIAAGVGQAMGPPGGMINNAMGGM